MHHLKKISHGPLCYMVTPHTTSRNCVAHRSVNDLLRMYGTLCEPLEIPSGPPVVHMDRAENLEYSGVRKKQI